MENILSAAAALALVAIASAADPTIFLEYHKDHKCASSSLSAVKLSSPQLGSSKCVDLGYPAKSFHVGAPASEKQVSADCEVIGYSDKDCNGGINVEIQGPSKADQCYITGVNMGNVAAVESVRLLCS